MQYGLKNNELLSFSQLKGAAELDGTSDDFHIVCSLLIDLKY